MAKGRKTASPQRPLVSRLVGLETEYATLVADSVDLASEDLPESRLVYTQICEAIRRDQPTVGGLYDREQMFLASGGAVTFESHPSMHSLPGGLVEIATPEVHTPTDLLACQRSIDRLASEATAESETSFDLRILKNSSDALGHVYGCHENYEAEVACGLTLLSYRCFIILLWGIQIVSFIVSLPIMLGILSIVSLSRLRRSKSDRHQQDDDRAGDGAKDQARQSDFQQNIDQHSIGDEGIDDDAENSGIGDFFDSIPSWLSSTMILLLRLVHLPTVVTLGFVARHIAFRRIRKYLTPMLISRVALCGSGNMDPDGCYQTSAKAMAIDSVAHMGGFSGERPIYVYGHWLSQFCAKSFFSLWSTKQMLNRRQRLQIGLSDSNLSDLAEYVKVGSVSLLLDMIEAGHVAGLPIVSRPVESLHHLASDWNLVARVPTNRGKMSALEIQKIYLTTAEAFVGTVPANMHGEAKLVLYRWKELYESAARYRKNAADVAMAIGRIDWLTKRHLIDSLDENAGWIEKKKIDLRYHELSPDGYYYQLIKSRPELLLVAEDQIERRRRSPPAGSPAARRGWLIREFAGSDEIMQSEWAYAIIGRGRKKRRVEFGEERHKNER